MGDSLPAENGPGEAREGQGEVETLKGVGMTALIVAQARAVESERTDRLFDDPFAAEFVARAGPGFAAAAREIAPVLALRGNGRYFAIRTRFFDDWALEASRAGCDQVVLLGAGLDTRAFRLAWPEGVRLFELDLPDVLAFKEEALTARAAAPRCERIAVRVDLRADWPAALAAAGFSPDRPAAWLLEGVLMYLAETERDQLLDRIGQLSAPGSRLALEQRGIAEPSARPASPVAPSAAPIEAGDSERERLVEQARRDAEARVARLGVQLSSGEPDPSMADPGAWLGRHGWQARVSSAAELFTLHGRSVPPSLAAGAVQLWLATGERA